jgi:hypothetical protein
MRFYFPQFIRYRRFDDGFLFRPRTCNLLWPSSSSFPFPSCSSHPIGLQTCPSFRFRARGYSGYRCARPPFETTEATMQPVTSWATWTPPPSSATDSLRSVMRLAGVPDLPVLDLPPRHYQLPAPGRLTSRTTLPHSSWDGWD